MGFNTNLRLVIKAFCTPAAIALLTHPGAAHADITASNASYVYVGAGTRDITTFRLNVADNQAFVPDIGTIQLVEVNGSPRPVQLIDASVMNDPDSGVLATLSRFRNCIMVTVTSPPNDSESPEQRSGTFSIDYAVTDGNSGQVSRATLRFAESDHYNFTTADNSRCDDPAFKASQAMPDMARTTAGTPVAINVLANDLLPENKSPTLITRGSQSGARLQVNNDGSITYVPADGFTGTDTFAYTIRDYSEKGFEEFNPDTSVTVTVTPVVPPKPSVATIAVNDAAIASGDSISIADADTLPGETVRFDGSQSTLSSGKPPTSYRWFVNEALRQEGPNARFEPTLADGTSLVSLTVSDGEQEASSDVIVTVEEYVEPPTNTATILVNGTRVENGERFTVANDDAAPGEEVTFDGSQTLVQGDERPTDFQWFIDDSDTPNSRDPVFKVRLASGTSRVRLIASLIDGETIRSVESMVSISVDAEAPQSEDTAIIAVNGAVVTNGDNVAVADKDATLGEVVTFDGSQTLIFGELQPTRFRWFVGDGDTPQQDGPSPSFAPRLPDGISTVRLVAVFEGEGTVSASSFVTVTVAAAAVTPPTPSKATIIVNGTAVSDGGAFSLADTDFAPGEKANFDGSQSTLAGGGQPTRFQWFVNDTLQQDGDSARFAFNLGDGGSQVRLVASDGETSAASVVNVTVAGVITLAEIPNLTPNQREVARALDSICSQLVQRLQSEQALTENQQDLLERCQGILAANTGDQIRALDELSAQDFNAARLQTLLFTNALYAGVMDRLMALRGGVKGLSLAGLNVVIDGQSVPLAELEHLFGQLLGGGAAADEPGSLLGDKWGAWSRGNFTFGSKAASDADNGFDAEQFSLTAGLDYRLSDKTVIGGAIAFGSSNISYDPNNEGGLDTQTWAVSIYGSRYAAKNFYVDALVNAANSSFEAHRRISYNDALGTVERDARGDTDGLTLSGGLSGGYDFLYKGWTLSPNAGFFYVDSTIDRFREGGSRGLNLVYEEQNFESLTTTLGMRVNYAWSLPWGVVIPYFRGDYVLELKNDVEAFSVRFASDPGNPTTPIIVKSDNPDQSYFRLTAGVSGQFPFGISGYVEYQRLQGFEFVSFNDLSMGLRVQYRY